jgi:hypothetical protein
MKHIKFASLRFLTLSILAVASLPLHAAEPRTVRWNDVCRVTTGRQLTITTTNGGIVDGYCISVDVDEIAVATKDRGIVKIARTAFSRIQMSHPNKRHQLRSLHKGVHEGLRQGFGWLLSPQAPLGMVAVPVTLAWGAMAAPFCVLGDLKDKMAAREEIRVM